MAKKRRVSQEQARLLAIAFIQRALENEEEFGSQVIPDDMPKPMWYLRYVLPENWTDGNTSEKSWHLLWLEVTLQLVTILKGLDKEAVRIRLENPDFRYSVQYPLSNGIAPKTV